MEESQVNLKKLLNTVVLTTSALLLMACGNSGAEGNESGEPVVNYEEALTEDPTGTQVILGTNNSGDGREAFLAQKFEEAGFNVEFVPIGGSEITARVIAEVENPTLNVVWGPSDDNFQMMINAGALAPWEPTWLEQVADTHHDNGYSYPYEIQPKLWVANKNQFDEENSPSTVNELYENEEFHGLYTVPTSFGGATNRAIIASILGQYLDEDGELGVAEEGWEAINAFFEHGIRTSEAENDYGNMVSGKTPITFSFASGLYDKSQQFGDANIIYFENGQPSNVNEIGVVNTNDPEILAESYRLANFIGSAEFMSAVAGENGNIVTNTDAADGMTDIAQEVYDKFTEQDLDWGTINPLMDDWVAKIQLEIY